MMMQVWNSLRVFMLILLSMILSVKGIELSLPNDGGIVAGQNIQISFGGGQAPYILTILGFNPKNADNQIAQFTGQQGPNIQWSVNVPDGYIRFNATDSVGGSNMSFWQVVYPNPNIGASSISTASTASVASAQSVQAYISGLSTSAQRGMRTNAATSTSVPNQRNSGPIIGGVVAGVTVLLAIGLVAFWRINRAYPKTRLRNEDGVTIWSSDAHNTTLAEPTITPYVHYYDAVPAGSPPPQNSSAPAYYRSEKRGLM